MIKAPGCQPRQMPIWEAYLKEIGLTSFMLYFCCKFVKVCPFCRKTFLAIWDKKFGLCVGSWNFCIFAWGAEAAFSWCLYHDACIYITSRLTIERKFIFLFFSSSIMKCILKDLILAKKKLPVRKTNFERFAFSGKMRHRGGGRVHTLKKPKKTWRFGNCQRCCIQIE